MEKYIFDEKVVSVISDKANCISTSEAYVGENIFNINLYSANQQEAYLICTKSDNLQCIETVREDLDDLSCKKMISDIETRINNAIANVNAVIVENPEEVKEIIKQPLILHLDANEGIANISKAFKILSTEFNDWLDELTVMKTSKVSAKEAEAYQQEYEKIISANLIPHDESEVKDYTNTMTIVCFIFAVLGVIFNSTCVFPVITVVASGFTAYRCYTSKNKIACGICIACCIIGVVFTYVGWTSFMTSMKLSMVK